MIRQFIRRILGNGASASDARAPLVFGRDEHGIDPDDVSSNAVRVTETLQRAGFKAFIVGGAVRDLVDSNPKILMLQPTPHRSKSSVCFAGRSSLVDGFRSCM